MSPVVPLHLGAVHGYEAVLLVILAFGPFVVLTIVVLVLRRRDNAAADVEQGPLDRSPEPPADG